MAKITAEISGCGWGVRKKPSGDGLRLTSISVHVVRCENAVYLRKARPIDSFIGLEPLFAHGEAPPRRWGKCNNPNCVFHLDGPLRVREIGEVEI